MFKIAVTESYFAPVEVQLPGVKGKQTFEIEFLRLSQDALNNIVKRAKATEIDDQQFVREVVVGWNSKHVLDSEGQPIEFSKHALDELMNIYPVPSAIVEAYYASISGARIKN